jgi:hypothetical protein
MLPGLSEFKKKEPKTGWIAMLLAQKKGNIL